MTTPYVTIEGDRINGVWDAENEKWVFAVTTGNIVTIPLPSDTNYDIVSATNVTEDDFDTTGDLITWEAELNNSSEDGSLVFEIEPWGNCEFTIAAQT